MERMTKVQEVILKATARTLKWWEAAKIIGVSDRTMRRWRERYQEVGYDGLYDRRQPRQQHKRLYGRVLVRRRGRDSAVKKLPAEAVVEVALPIAG